MNDEPMYPLFLNLRGRNCVVVGGNPMFEAKVRDLLQAGARVKVIASEVTDAIATWASTERVQWEKRDYVAGDLRDAFVIVTAAGNKVNAEVYAEAEARNVLCNAVDDVEHCNCFRFLGNAPAVRCRSQSLPRAIAQPLHNGSDWNWNSNFGPEYFSWVKELGKLRRRLFSEPELGPEARRQRLHEQASAQPSSCFDTRKTRRLRDKRLGRNHAKPCRTVACPR